MFAHANRSVTIASLVVAGCAFWIAGCGKKNDDRKNGQPSTALPMTSAGQQSVPARLPEPIVKAWTQAGAQVGWLRKSTGFGFLPASAPPMTGDVACFFISPWPNGVVSKLPPPQQPFGLSFNAEDSGLTNASLKELAEFKELQLLDLRNTPVTDAGLKELVGLKGLKTLLYGGSKVTQEGLTELRKALPNCETLAAD